MPPSPESLAAHSTTQHDGGSRTPTKGKDLPSGSDVAWGGDTSAETRMGDAKWRAPTGKTHGSGWLLPRWTGR